MTMWQKKNGNKSTEGIPFKNNEEYLSPHLEVGPGCGHLGKTLQDSSEALDFEIE